MHNDCTCITNLHMHNIKCTYITKFAYVYEFAYFDFIAHCYWHILGVHPGNVAWMYAQISLSYHTCEIVV